MESYGTEMLGTAGATGPVGVEPVVRNLVDRVELDRVTHDLIQMKVRATVAERSFHLVAEKIREEAIEREWCSDYDEFVDDVNAEIARLGGDKYGLQMQSSEHDYDVTVTVTVRMTKTMSGKSERDINDYVRENDSWHDGIEITDGWELDDFDLENVRSDKS